MDKTVKRSGEVCQWYYCLETTTNCGRLLKKEQFADPGDDQDGRWGDISVPRESRVRVSGSYLGILNPTLFGTTSILFTLVKSRI